MIFGGWQKFSLIDFPGRASAILFTQGCPFRCHFCHNPELVNPAQAMFTPVTEEEIMDFLATRRGKLDGVVITGGEPTLHPDLPEFMEKIKSLCFAVKLDTNGSRPDVLERIIAGGLADYIAMDYKAPLAKYGTVAGPAAETANVRRSARMIMNSVVPYEFRTTVVKELLSEDDIILIAKEIAGAKKYILQKFRPDKTLNPLFSEATTYSDEEFERMTKKIKSFVAQCLWR